MSGDVRGPLKEQSGSGKKDPPRGEGVEYRRVTPSRGLRSEGTPSKYF